MQVRFTKIDGKRYTVTIRRERGPALAPRFGPGYDDLMPHDVAHFVVEEQFAIELGVWGQLAAGGGGIFSPAPEDNTLRHQRRVQRIAAVGHADMVRSEQLVVLVVAGWERSIGRVKHQTRTITVPVAGADLARAIRRMDEVAEQWRALPHGGSLSLGWPARLTFDASGSARGRRTVTRTRPGSSRLQRR